jgi:hypothetical protein
VELPDAAALLDPTAWAGEELEPTDSTVVFAAAAPWSTVFITVASVATFVATALSAVAFSTAATFAIVASSAAFTTVASSDVLVSTAFSVVATAAESSIAVEADPLPPDPSDVVNAATVGSGCDAVATLEAYCLDSGGTLTVDPPL